MLNLLLSLNFCLNHSFFVFNIVAQLFNIAHHNFKIGWDFISNTLLSLIILVKLESLHFLVECLLQHLIDVVEVNLFFEDSSAAIVVYVEFHAGGVFHCEDKCVAESDYAWVCTLSVALGFWAVLCTVWVDSHWIITGFQYLVRLEQNVSNLQEKNIVIYLPLLLNNILLLLHSLNLTIKLWNFVVLLLIPLG